MSNRYTRGFALVPVVLMLSLIGSIAYIIGMESSMTSRSMDRQFEARQAGYTAEAAYHHARWRLERTPNCTGYSTLTSTLGASSYTATVTPDNGSPVMVTATGMTGTDSTGTVQGSVTTFSDNATVVLQPGSEGIDAFIWDGAHEDTNFGVSPILRLDSTGKEQAILIQFDVSALATGAIIRKADLELYAYSGTLEQSGVVRAHNLTVNWVEGVLDDQEPNSGDGVTYWSPNGGPPWSDAGGDFDPSPAAETAIPNGTPAWFTWDVTNSLIGWSEDTLANHGLLLRVSSGDLNRREFASSDATDATLRPKLTIEYACACGTPCSDALPTADSIVLSTEKPAALGGVAFEQTDLVDYNPETDLASIRLEGFPLGLGEYIDALHIQRDGSYVLSTRDDETLGGLSFSKEDLIRYDASTNIATTYFKSRLHFDAGGEIDGVMVLPSGNLVLSTTGDSEIAGITMAKNDLVEFDPRFQTARLFFNGDAAVLEKPPFAVHVLSNGHLVMALEKETSFAGTTVYPSDLVEYDPASGTTALYMSGVATFGNVEDAIRSVSILDGQSLSVPSDPRLLAYWKLDETSGIVAKDSAGDHDGQLNEPDWVTGQVGGAADFNGSGDVISVPHADTLSLQAEFTFSAWFRLDAVLASGSYRILSKESLGQNDNYFLSLQDGALYLGIDGEFFSPPYSFFPGVWYHVAATFDDDADEVRIYVDGVEELSVSTSARLAPNTDPLYLGSNWQGGTKGFRGPLDEIRIYNYALAAEEINGLMTATNPGTGEPGGGGGSSGSSTGTYRDEFSAGDTYAGSNGSLDWNTPWVEINESDGPERGDEVLSNEFESYQLRIADNDSRGEGVYRAVDLAGCAASSFSFDYRRDGFDRSSDYVTVSASNDDGANWIDLQTIEGRGTDASLITSRHDLADFLSKDARVRFLTSSSLGGSDYLYVDNVEITCQ